MTNKLWTVCIFILAVECCERLCYYAIGGTMRNFLMVDPFNYGNGQAQSINAAFTMTSYVSCFLGGYMGDNVFGRFKTILYFGICYFIGTVMVVIAALPSFMNLPVYLIGTLLMISLGTGAIKPNVMNFGASQYNEDDPHEKADQKRFFSYFYLMINVGAGVAFGGLVNVATSTQTYPDVKIDGVVTQITEPGDGYIITYSIAAACMGLAILCFLLGSFRYKVEPPTVHKPLLRIVCKYVWRSAGSVRGMSSVIGWILVPITMILQLVGAVIPSKSVSWPLSIASMTCCILAVVLLCFAHLKTDWIKEFEEPLVGTSITLADVRKTLRLIPQLIIVNIGFNIPYNAMNNAYPAQACQMDLLLPWGSRLNGALTSLGDCFAILIGVPIIEGWLLPKLEARKGHRIARNSKYIVGFTLVILANVSAIFVELARRRAPFMHGPHKEIESPCAAPGVIMKNISFIYAFIPMFITGIAEILVNPVVYQFAFEMAPGSMMSIVQALNLVVAGSLSNCITGPLAVMLFPNDLDKGDVNLTFYANIGFGILCFAAFLVISKIDEVPPEDRTMRGEETGGSYTSGSNLGSFTSRH